MTREDLLFKYLKTLGVECRDRRPTSPDPLPFRVSSPSGNFGAYKVHDFEKTRGLCFHHSAAKQQKDGSIVALAKGHLERWPTAGGLAYTLAITPEGVVNLAWNLDLRLFSQGWTDDKTKPETLGDENVFFKGVLVEGNMKGPLNPTGTDEPTPAQMTAVVAIREAFAELWGKTEVTGHFEHGKPACPGATLEAWVRANREYTAKAGGQGSGAGVAPLPLPDPTTPKGLQTALKELGLYGGAIDGVVGPITKKAVVDFQTKNALTPDGIVGVKTAARLLELVKKKRGT